MKQSRLHSIYRGMHTRCFDSSCKSYKYYGAKGITICDEWINKEKIGNTTKGWIAFKEWALSHGYKEGLSIDRIDSNKNYSPGNCRWVTPKEQANNNSHNHCITYMGKTQSLAKWCDELHLPYNMVKFRINRRHWPIEKALGIKENAGLKLITYRGKTQSVADWCRELHLKYNAIRARIRRGWSAEQAFETDVKRCGK